MTAQQKMNTQFSETWNVDLTDPIVIGIFGDNVQCALKLLDMPAGSLATKTEMEVNLFAMFIEGEGLLNADRVTNIASVININPEHLFHQEENEVDRESYFYENLEIPNRDESDNSFGLELVADDTSQDDSECSRKDEYSEEDVRGLDPEWQDDQTVVLGTRIFDLKSKETRASIGDHFRAAKGDSSIAATFKKGEVDKPSSWFSGMCQGKSRMVRDDLERMAKGCGTTVAVLLTGTGLDLSAKVAYGRKQTGRNKNNQNDYFRKRMMSPNQKYVEGKNPQDIVVLLGSGGHVDWKQTWLEYTQEGHKSMDNATNIAQYFKKVSPEVRELYFTEIEKACKEGAS